jgi:hypothetical protein
MSYPPWRRNRVTDSIDRTERFQATLDAWRANGDDRVNRTRFRVIEAMLRRATAYESEARRVIDARVSVLIDRYAQDITRARARSAEATQDSPLAALLGDMRQRAATRIAPDDLLDDLRTVYSKVSAEKRLRESQAQVPKNAGPLNSNSLVHRSLSLMREASPAYFEHFLGYLDALAWMEEAVFASSAPANAPGAKKAARVKAR